MFVLTVTDYRCGTPRVLLVSQGPVVFDIMAKATVILYENIIQRLVYEKSPVTKENVRHEFIHMEPFCPLVGVGLLCEMWYPDGENWDVSAAMLDRIVKRVHVEKPAFYSSSSPGNLK